MKSGIPRPPKYPESWPMCLVDPKSPLVPRVQAGSQGLDRIAGHVASGGTADRLRCCGCNWTVGLKPIAAASILTNVDLSCVVILGLWNRDIGHYSGPYSTASTA